MSLLLARPTRPLEKVEQVSHFEASSPSVEYPGGLSARLVRGPSEGTLPHLRSTEYPTLSPD